MRGQGLRRRRGVLAHRVLPVPRRSRARPGLARPGPVPPPGVHPRERPEGPDHLRGGGQRRPPLRAGLPVLQGAGVEAGVRRPGRDRAREAGRRPAHRPQPVPGEALHALRGHRQGDRLLAAADRDVRPRATATCRSGSTPSTWRSSRPRRPSGSGSRAGGPFASGSRRGSGTRRSTSRSTVSPRSTSWDRHLCGRFPSELRTSSNQAKHDSHANPPRRPRCPGDAGGWMAGGDSSPLPSHCQSYSTPNTTQLSHMLLGGLMLPVSCGSRSSGVT